jgi:hypothetical protein
LAAAALVGQIQLTEQEGHKGLILYLVQSLLLAAAVVVLMAMFHQIKVSAALVALEVVEELIPVVEGGQELSVKETMAATAEVLL